MESSFDQPAEDLSSQLEDIFHCVQLAEDDWRLNDRLDLAFRISRAQSSEGEAA